MTRGLLLAALAVVAAVGCDPASATPTPSPATAPTIALGNWTATSGHWTFTATVNPRDSPTDVVFEWGLGPESAPVFDQTIPVEHGLIDAAAVSASLDLGQDEVFCARFVATNDVGSAKSDPYCSGPPRSIIVVPNPTEAPGASSSP